MSYETRSPQTERECEEYCWLGSDSSLDPINGKDGLLQPPLSLDRKEGEHVTRRPACTSIG
jgi:hypothetical protein